LERSASAFLAKYHPSGRLPVPIEEIVEFQLKLGLLPLPDLERNFDIHGFATIGRKEIVVDERQMLKQSDRHRFTVAHELGHLILHEDLYAAAKVTDMPSYLAFQESLTEEDIRDLEFQACNWAGRVLVPKSALLPLALSSLKVNLPKLGKNPSLRLICKAIARDLYKRFEVHPDVVETRLHGDRLSGELGIGSR